MTYHPHLRSEDDATIEELIADCGCLRERCTCSGVALEPPVHLASRRSGDYRISDDVQHMTDGMNAYGD